MFKINEDNNNNDSNNKKRFYSQDLVSFPCPPLKKKYSFLHEKLNCAVFVTPQKIKRVANKTAQSVT